MYRIKSLNCIKNIIIDRFNMKNLLKIVTDNSNINSTILQEVGLRNSNQNVFDFKNFNFIFNKKRIIGNLLLKMNHKATRNSVSNQIGQFENRVSLSDINNNGVVKKYSSFLSHTNYYRRKEALTEAFPKNALHNYFVKVAKNFQTPSVLLQKPLFDQYSFKSFLCTYSFRWPKNFEITAWGIGKKGSSRRAATNAVHWLKNHAYMDNYGNPIWNRNLSSKPLQSRNYCQGNSEFHQSLITNTKEIDSVKVLFQAPKSTLHNFFKAVSDELKNTDLILEPKYRSTKKIAQQPNWTCTYNLKWPQVKKFSATGLSKQDASNNAALLALAWLKQNRKINSSGKLMIYDKDDYIDITQRSHPVLHIKEQVKEKLQKITDIYESELDSLINMNQQEMLEIEKSTKSLENEWPETKNFENLRRKYKDLSFYLAHEEVQLPISKFKEEIMEKLSNQVVIIKGEPGCGKSTRVPQYVLEAWAKDENSSKMPCKIVITQPRRIAAISLAERVASERNERVGPTVGYQVRLQSNFSNKTGHILFCTTGILLRRLQSDPKLSDCTHIILDEAHERDVNTDLLMNLLKKSLKLNPNLKVLVMSATIDTKIFQDYFDNAPVIHIPGFTYPVKEHFLGEKNTPELHKTQEMCEGNYPGVVHEDVVKLIQSIHKNKPGGAILCFLPGWEDIIKVQNLIPENSNLSVLCLHSRLEVKDQKKIFGRPPYGTRKVILSTNIAETSVTIDDVVYVIDSGIHKEQRFENSVGAMCIDNRWISKASAIQRKGRAGRCQPGECFHLYSKSKYREMDSYSMPEILRTSLTKIVLDLKVYSNNMNSHEFLNNLICPPDKAAVTKAIAELTDLEMLDSQENVTPLGRTVSEFQMAPKLAKAMVNSVIFKCVTPIVDIATLFSSETAIFSKDLTNKDSVRSIKSSYHNTSDHLALMFLLEEWISLMQQHDNYAAKNFCSDTGLVFYKMNTLKQLRSIHFEYLIKGLKPIVNLISDDYSDNNELVLSILLSGVNTVLQHRNWDIAKGRLKRSNVFITKNKQKATITSESVNCRKTKFSSNVLLHLNETISNLRHTTLVRETSVISPIAYLLFANGNLNVEEIPEKQFSNEIQSSNQVLLGLEGSNLKFFCDHKDAITIKKCKDSLKTCVQHYIYQLTKGGQSSPKINESWNKILENLSDSL